MSQLRGDFMENMATKVMDLKIKKTMENLKRNNMEPFCCETSQEALELAKSLVCPGATVTHGGSETLIQLGIPELLSGGDYNYLDRSAEGLTREQVEEIYRKSYFADYYFTSSNAVTETGELYNVDGNSNRVSAILYGPKNVLVFVGINKIVRDINEAITRVKTIAAPANTLRLSCDTPCAKTGECVSLKSGSPLICSGCHSEQRICCNYVVSAQQRHKNRIKVIIIKEQLGY